MLTRGSNLSLPHPSRPAAESARVPRAFVQRQSAALLCSALQPLLCGTPLAVHAFPGLPRPSPRAAAPPLGFLLSGGLGRVGGSVRGSVRRARPAPARQAIAATSTQSRGESRRGDEDSDAAAEAAAAAQQPPVPTSTSAGATRVDHQENRRTEEG